MRRYDIHGEAPNMPITIVMVAFFKIVPTICIITGHCTIHSSNVLH